jgi:hypothetical protein
MFRISAPKSRAALIAGVLTPALAATVAAAPAASATAIGPNQLFAAQVTGFFPVPGMVAMACYGPTYPNQTGHPMAGQYVEVMPATTASGNIGFTGSLATAINVEFVYSQGAISHVVPIGTLTAYDTKLAIPTSLVLPCWGSGTAVFDPTPTSPTARAADVKINFQGQP